MTVARGGALREQSDSEGSQQRIAIVEDRGSGGSR